MFKRTKTHFLDSYLVFDIDLNVFDVILILFIVIASLYSVPILGHYRISIDIEQSFAVTINKSD